MDDRYPGLTINQRVRVLIHGSSMSRPSGVSNANGSGKIVEVILCIDLFQSTAVLLDCELVSVDGYFSDGVVASIL